MGELETRRDDIEIQDENDDCDCRQAQEQQQQQEFEQYLQDLGENNLINQQIQQSQIEDTQQSQSEKSITSNNNNIVYDGSNDDDDDGAVVEHYFVCGKCGKELIETPSNLAYNGENVYCDGICNRLISGTIFHCVDEHDYCWRCAKRLKGDEYIRVDGKLKKYKKYVN